MGPPVVTHSTTPPSRCAKRAQPGAHRNNSFMPALHRLIFLAKREAGAGFQANDSSAHEGQQFRHLNPDSGWQQLSANLASLAGVSSAEWGSGGRRSSPAAPTMRWTTGPRNRRRCEHPVAWGATADGGFSLLRADHRRSARHGEARMNLQTLLRRPLSGSTPHPSGFARQTCRIHCGTLRGGIAT